MTKCLPSWAEPSEKPLPEDLEEFIRYLKHDALNNISDDYKFPKMFESYAEKMGDLTHKFNKLPRSRKETLLSWDELPVGKYKLLYILASEAWNDWRASPWDYGIIIPSVKMHFPRSVSEFCRFDRECTIDPEYFYRDTLYLYSISGYQHLCGEIFEGKGGIKL